MSAMFADAELYGTAESLANQVIELCRREGADEFQVIALALMLAHAAFVSNAIFEGIVEEKSAMAIARANGKRSPSIIRQQLAGLRQRNIRRIN